MKVKCFACALAAGMALSAVAMAEPGQAGAPVQGSNVVSGVLPIAKGMIPGKAVYHYATREWTLISMPGTSEPAGGGVRGPGFNLIWEAADNSGFYWNDVGGIPGAEIEDGGILCGDPLVDTHTVNQFSFTFQTTTIATPPGGGDLTKGVSINFYWGYDPLCPVGVNGGVADESGCGVASGMVQYDITGLPGSTAGEAVAWNVTIDLTGVETVIPAGPFGWSHHTWLGYGDPTGFWLAAENQISGPGMENSFNAWTGAPHGAPLIGNYWFGGTPFAQFFFSVFAFDTTCGASDLGSCCLADLSCVVVNEADCTAQGGTGFQLGVACAGAFACYPAPANDDCLSAQVISGFGQFAYDNRGATTGTEGDPTCGPQGEDVWMSWESPCTGSVEITGCLLNLTDDLWSVYSGDCGSLVEVGCGDDSCNIGGGPSTVTFSATQGTNYLFRLGTWASSDGGENFVDVIQGGDCVAGGFCDADWCQDGSVGVPDIFCFLGDWFNNVPAAINYGGSPGVPAIFAFLGVWFATPQGPCTP